MSQSEWSSRWREDTEYIGIDIDQIVHVSERAVLVRIDDYEHWIPLSVLEPGTDGDLGEENILHVAEWFAEREGFI